MKILIAEDDPTSHRILKTILERSGYEVVAHDDGRSAFEALRAPDAPRLAVLDWMMPEMDGSEVVSSLRKLEEPSSAYLILLTAKDRKDDIVAGLDAGADDYVIKPFDRRELLSRIAVGARIVSLQSALSERVRELERAMSEISTLRGLIPMCAGCKRIRTDTGYWQDVAVYLSEHSEADISHGMCPECMTKFYPEYEDEK